MSSAKFLKNLGIALARRLCYNKLSDTKRVQFFLVEKEVYMT